MRQDNPDIPLHFPSAADKPELKRDLERLANGVAAQAKSAQQRFSSNFDVSAPQVSDCAASFGQITRIGTLGASALVNVQLPPPDPKNGGKQLGVQRTTASGTVYLRPVGKNAAGENVTINGRASLMLLGSVLLTTVTFDGQHYYADNPGAVPWGG